MAYVGWYPRRVGLLAHLESGVVSLLDIAIHDVLSLWADRQTGVCWGSAEKIKVLCPAEFSYKSIQRSLAKLSSLGWIKRWIVRGKRGNYPILVCRYFVRDASMTWRSTSGDRTTDWRNVQFDAVHDPSFNRPSSVRRGVRRPVHELGDEVSAAVSGNLEVEGRRKTQKGEKTKTSDPRLDSVTDSVFKEAQKQFRRLVEKPLGVLGKRGPVLRDLIARHGRETVLESFVRWTEENIDFARTAKVPVAAFLKRAEEYIEVVVAEREGKRPARPADTEPQIPNLVEVVIIKTGKRERCAAHVAERWFEIGHARPIPDSETMSSVEGK